MAAQYSRAVATETAGQIAHLSGFEAVQRSANEALADLLLRYICELGASAHAYSEVAGRTNSNVSDLLLAVADLGVTIADLKKYASINEEDLCLAHEPVLKYPVIKLPTLQPSFLHKGEEPPSHVPSYLPAFPDSHTYTSTPVFAAHTPDVRQQLLVTSRAQRQAEKAAVQLHKRLHTANNAEQPLLPTNLLAHTNTAAMADNNPFLAAPLPAEDLQPGRDDRATSAVPVESFQPAFSDTQAGSAGWSQPAVLESTTGVAAAAGVNIDWTEAIRKTAVASVAHLGFEDAFEEAEDDVSQGKSVAVERRRKAAGRTSSKRRQPDAVSQRAEEILAAGAGAAMDDEGERQPAERERI